MTEWAPNGMNDLRWADKKKMVIRSAFEHLKCDRFEENKGVFNFLFKLNFIQQTHTQILLGLCTPSTQTRNFNIIIRHINSALQVHLDVITTVYILCKLFM